MQPKRTYLSLILALLASLLLLWSATGTLSPYAATYVSPHLSTPCAYLYSFDNCHFEASYWFLSGEERQSWEWSIYLRRIFYPLISFPLMKILGFVLGGVITNFLLFSLSFCIFVCFVAKRFGSTSAQSAAWLLATYAGSAYWIGLPYQMAAIVPASLICTVLFAKVQSENSFAKNLRVCLLLGFIALAHDALVLSFLVAIALKSLVQKRTVLQQLALLFSAALPSLLTIIVLTQVFNVPFSNPNSDQYGMLLKSYFDPPAWSIWQAQLTQLPFSFVHNFLFSNFFFIPVLFLVCYSLMARASGFKLSVDESCILLGIFAMWLFTNAAPYYGGQFELRGPTYARFYQHSIGAIMLAIARMLQLAKQDDHIRRSVLKFAVTATVVLSSLLILSPYYYPIFAGQTYHQFYGHSNPDQYEENLKRYGLRPLGSGGCWGTEEAVQSSQQCQKIWGNP